MVACSEAKFTLASLTPGSFLSPFSMRMAQDAHVMPSKASAVRLSGHAGSCPRSRCFYLVCLASIVIVLTPCIFFCRTLPETVSGSAKLLHQFMHLLVPGRREWGN